MEASLVRKWVNSEVGVLFGVHPHIVFMFAFLLSKTVADT